MNEFLTLRPPFEALKVLLDQINTLNRNEEVDSAHALDRVTAHPITAPYPLPAFPRSTVDGYAVRAADTYGAGESLPAYLKIRGEITMGTVPDFPLAPADSAVIYTGGMLPDGADAVVMVEHTQVSKPGEVEIMRALAIGDNVLHIGEDVAEGEEVILPGTRLRPAEIGGLMALGFNRITVRARPKVGIISSGDEVKPPGAPLAPGQVYDINTYTLSNLVTSAGGEPVSFGIVEDLEPALFSVAAKALSETDLVVLTAGSSVSTRDLTARVIDALGEPGILVHGVSVRPGKPTILGLCDGKPVIGLPGNPVSALVIARLFVLPIIAHLQGETNPRPASSMEARLTVNLASISGREDWIPVRLRFDGDGFMAEPVFGKSNLIFTLARADGLVRIPPDETGLESGALVQVTLL